MMQNLKSTISKTLFTIARSPLGAIIIGWSFQYMTSIMPIDKLYETNMVVAFHHPKPSHKIHVLIVPKKHILSITNMSPKDFPILQDIFLGAQEVIKRLGLAEKGYRLVVNGGKYQDVKQVHFHLISDE